MTSQKASPSRLWQSWKAFARRAAEIQSQVLLFVLYFLLLPIAVIRRAASAGTPRWRGGWHARPERRDDRAAARRQF